MTARRLWVPTGGLVALAAFAVVAGQVAGGGALTRLDADIAERLHEHADGSPGVWRLFRTVTRLGDGDARTLVGFAATLWLAWKRRWVAALICAGSMLLNNRLVDELKLAFERPRPAFEGAKYVAGGWSFPSGHAAGAMFAYGFVAYLVVRFGAGRWRWPVVAGLGLVILGVGFSRMYLGVHYLSDVLGGFALSLATLAAWVTLLELSPFAGKRPLAGQGDHVQ
jgi:undecaprenyl-diphosphatase